MLMNSLSNSVAGMGRNSRALGALLVLAAGACAPVWAQDAKQPAQRELQGNFDQPLNGQDQAPRAARAQRAQQGGVQSLSINTSTDESGTTIKVNRDGTEYEVVKPKDGEMSVKRAGKSLSKNEYRVKGSVVEFLDSDRNVEYSLDTENPGDMGGMGTFQMRIGGRNNAPQNGGNGWRIGGFAPQPPVAPQPPAVALMPGEHPPVMLGITMSEHDEGVRVESVKSGLPAEKAGIKVGDVITKVDGERVHDMTDIRNVLDDQSEGDEVEVVVLRDGNEQTMKLSLQAWDSEKLGTGGAGGEGEEVDGQLFAIPHGNNPWWNGEGNDDAKQALRDATKSLKEGLESLKGAQGDFAQAREQAQKAMREALEQITAARDEMEKARASVHLFAPQGEGQNLQLVLPRLLQEGQLNNDALKQLHEKLRAEFLEQGRKMDDNQRELRGKQAELGDAQGNAKDDMMRELRDELKALREEVREMKKERAKKDE